MILSVVLTIPACLCLVMFEVIKVKAFRENRRIANPFFVPGVLLLAAAWGHVLIRYFHTGPLGPVSFPVRLVIGGCLAAASLIFYGYVLFFALPGGTYGDAAGASELSKEGIYGWCRHPGFYGFTALALSLALLSGSLEALAAGVIYSLLNLVYIVVQDRCWFPVYIAGYEQYRRDVPFLGFPPRKPINTREVSGLKQTHFHKKEL
ncbi:MAG: methyltransferase [Lachnospiraceae bacterium]|nr:methyltransferase [Lachnospiraceae bacterium]